MFHIQRIEYSWTKNLLDEIYSPIQTSKPVMQNLDGKIIICSIQVDFELLFKSF